MSAPIGSSPWKAALASLTDDERQRFKITGDANLHILHDVLAAVEAKKEESSKRHLKYSWKGKPVILRDVFSKMATWVQRFVIVGDNAVQYDPAHAALPWAADTETIANTLTRCAVQEKLYATLALSIRNELDKAMSSTYAFILKYLCQVLQLLSERTVVRVLQATFDTKKKLEQLMIDLSKARDEIDRMAETAEAEKSRALAEAVAKVQEDGTVTAVNLAERDKQLLLVLHNPQEPVIRIDTALDSLEVAEKGKLTAWGPATTSALRSDRIMRYCMKHWSFHITACGSQTDEEMLDKQLKGFLLNGLPASSPYRQCREAEATVFEGRDFETLMPKNPLFFVSDIDRDDLLQELLKLDVVTSGEWNGEPPQRHSTAAGFAQQIIDHDADGLAALVDALGQVSDLLSTVERGRTQTARYLVSRGIGSKYLSKALKNAYSYDNLLVAEMCERHGAIKEKAAVARALRKQLFDTARKVIDAGYEVNGLFLHPQRTALHIAVQHGRADIVQLLLQHGAKVDVYDGKGLQPHHLTARLGHWECLRLLQNDGADMELPDISGWTIAMDNIPVPSAVTTAVDGGAEIYQPQPEAYHYSASPDGSVKKTTPPSSPIRSDTSGEAEV